MWITTMSLVVLAIGTGTRTASAQGVDEGCYELGSLCTNGRQCCSGICERDAEAEQSLVTAVLSSYCTSGI
jgi:hypothetical protein